MYSTALWPEQSLSSLLQLPSGGIRGPEAELELLVGGASASLPQALGSGVTAPLRQVTFSLAMKPSSFKVVKTAHQGSTQSLSLTLARLVREMFRTPPVALGPSHSCPHLQPSGLASQGSAGNDRSEGVCQACGGPSL